MNEQTPGKIGTPSTRIDGRLKVTGAARYPADERVDNTAWAYLVTSSISKGEISEFDWSKTRGVPGILDILSYENVSGDEDSPPMSPSQDKTTTTMESSKVWHDGQIIGIVVAETFEAAREGAQAVSVTYNSEAPSAGFDSEGSKQEKRSNFGQHADISVGHAEKAFAEASVTVDEMYETPTQHHNPIELFGTTCYWTGDQLTILESSQSVHGLRGSIAKQLDMDPEKIIVNSRFIGGAFGSKGIATARTAWIAIAAKRLGRPVKLVATRDQGFTIATYRAETKHRFRLAADEKGVFTALLHEGWELTSRPSTYNVSGNESTARMYACPNIETTVNLVHADRNTPGFMRAPPEVPYMFALESAVDELAYKLKMDPVELRRINDTQVDPVTKLAYSSRNLMKCFDQASERFGWKKRNPIPASMRDGEWLIGYGCATACYPSNMTPATARVTLYSNKTALVETATHEIGNGAYTVVAIAAADRLGLPVDSIKVSIGSSTLPAAGIAGGSSQAASVCAAVVLACEEIKKELGTTPIEKIANGSIEKYVETKPEGLPAGAIEKTKQGGMAMLQGTSRKDYTTFAFGAHFIEVKIHSRTFEIRVPRIVSAFASGTIVNPLAAHSQYMGGMIWGISSALHEKTEIDPVSARYVNDNLAEYLIPVNADIRALEVIMVPEEDSKVNPLGIKGIGEIGIVGVNAAVANAVFHATGKRIRKLPIRIEDILSA